MNRVVFSRDWLHHGAWGQRLNLSVNLMSILQNLQNASCDAESLSLAPGRREGGAHSMRQDLATEQQHVIFSSGPLLSRVRLFETLWTAACQASLSITISRSLLKLMSIESVMPSNHLNLCHPLPLAPVDSSVSSVSLITSELWKTSQLGRVLK